MHHRRRTVRQWRDRQRKIACKFARGDWKSLARRILAPHPPPRPGTRDAAAARYSVAATIPRGDSEMAAWKRCGRACPEFDSDQSRPGLNLLPCNRDGSVGGPLCCIDRSPKLKAARLGRPFLGRCRPVAPGGGVLPPRKCSCSRPHTRPIMHGWIALTPYDF
jgi:hypothetical protein